MDFTKKRYLQPGAEIRKTQVNGIKHRLAHHFVPHDPVPAVAKLRFLVTLVGLLTRGQQALEVLGVTDLLYAQKHLAKSSN